MKHEIHYQSTVLDLRAPVDLALLADALTDRGLFLDHAGPRHDDLWSATFTNASGFREPDQDIAVILTAIEALDEPAQSLWSACIIRDFNINYTCGNAPWAFNKRLSASTLPRIAAVSADLVMTINPIFDMEVVEAAVDILIKKKRIKGYIGKYQSLGVHQLDSLLIKRNQAEVKVTLHGKKGSVFVHCLMELTMEGEWGLKQILKEEARLQSPTP